MLALAGIGGAAFLATRKSEPAPADVAAVSDAVARATQTARAAADERVAWLAKMRPLLSALSTDAATMRDLRARELAFTPKAGERVEILQRFKDGHMVTLARIPEAAPAVPAQKDGVVVAAAGDGAEIVDVASVAPDDRADELVGVLAVAQAIDLAPARAAAGALGRASLTLPGGTLALTAEAPAADAMTTTPIAGMSGLALNVAAKKPPLGAAGAILGIALLGALILFVRKPAAAAATASASPPVTPIAGTPKSVHTIGRYEILRSLGEGGMAEVYLAKSTGEAGFEKRIALKVLNKQQAADPAAVEHFLDEARLAANLTHPNVVQISDLGKAGDAYYIAMEFVDGTDLSHLLDDCRARKERVPTAIALNLVRQICAGLHAAHTAHTVDGKPLGIVHRDVKSGNVFVARNGVVKIGDFGIAKAMESVRRTEVGMVKGTAEYMAPEQRVGGDVDARADQYSVGAIAYEILSGELINLDLARLAHLGVRGWPHLTPLAQLHADLPPALNDAVFQALAYSPADRFATCELFGEILGDIAQKHNLVVPDKTVAQWISGRLQQMNQQEDQKIKSTKKENLNF
ncbi:MAG TPA: serine/threonine-protein kinase [Polyangia bacterium]